MHAHQLELLQINKHLNYNKNIDSYIKDQLKRSSISIVLNIAEGSGRFSKADKRNFYIIARGSIYECISVLDILKEINVIDDNKYDELYKIGENITKMLIGLISSLVPNK